MLPLELSEKLSSNKIIIIEDSNCAPGRGYVLARSLSNQLIKEQSIFDSFIYLWVLTSEEINSQSSMLYISVNQFSESKSVPLPPPSPNKSSFVI